MFKVRLTGRQLVRLGLTGLFLLAAAYLTAPGLIFTRAQDFSSRGETKKATAYYETVAKYFPYSAKAARALYFSAQQDIRGNGVPGAINIFPRSIGTGDGFGPKESIEKAIGKFSAVIERYPQSPWARHSYRELGEAYYALSDYKNAEYYLMQSLEESGMGDSSSTELLTKIYLEQEQNEKALELVNKSLAQKPTANPLEMMRLKGEALMALKRFDQARQIFEGIPIKAERDLTELLQDEGQETVRMNIDHWQEISQRYLSQLTGLEEGENTGVIRGRITKNGEPMADVKVYLLQDYDDSHYSSNTEGIPFDVTDQKGRYQFENLTAGEYALGLTLMAEDIRGYTLRTREERITLAPAQAAIMDRDFIPVIELKSPLAGTVKEDIIQFAWQKVAGAAYYDIMLGVVNRDAEGNINGTYTGSFRHDIRDNELTVDIQDEIKKSRFSRSISYSGGKVDPLSVLGPLYYGGEYTWGVVAYDEAGERISDSTGYGFFAREKDLPMFKIEDTGLTDADRLLLERKYEEAVAQYQKRLQENSKDVHALLVLARLYDLGIEHDQKNPAEAAKYYRRVLAVEDTPEVRKALADAYYNAGMNQEAMDIFETLLGTGEEQWYVHYRIARLQFHLGEPAKALANLKNVVAMENGEYVREFPVILALLLNKNEQALWFAEQVDDGSEYLQLLKQYIQKGYAVKTDSEKAIAAGHYDPALESLGDSAHDQFIKGLLIRATARNYPRELLEESIAEINDDTLAAFFEKLAW
ncbi:tetratricopeptide repeat protein [Metallumcola ferriviriculae]|uniref:Tetratricopeptide repeat protein n=1 Tax=Metallumcola ferriviriculae TaxID=3039180 RepID=A0AAU0URF9_9FIRM|nr:tetratricopeptide repeat protein [Desulfitibacteraceae bacterium MK1]